MRKIVLFLLFSIASLSVSRAQEIEILFHVLDLRPTNYTQNGYLDIALPVYDLDNQRVLAYSFSDRPSEIIKTEKQYTARWTAEKLKGLTSLQVRATIISSANEEISFPDSLTIFSTGSSIKQSFKKTKSWEEIGQKDLPNKYNYLLPNNTSVVSSKLSKKSGPYVTRVKSYWTDDSEEILKMAYSFYGFEDNVRASYIFENLSEQYSNDQKFQRFRAIALSRLGEVKRPLEILHRLKETAKNKKELAEVYYAISNCYAIANEKEKAVENLLAAKKTYRYFDLCLADRDYDFINLVKYQPFLDLIKKCH